MRPLFHPSIEEITVEAILHALADPVRVALYAEIVASACPRSCSSLMGISEKAVPKPPPGADSRSKRPFLPPILLRNPASWIDRRRLHRRRLRLDVHRTEGEAGGFLDESRRKDLQIQRLRAGVGVLHATAGADVSVA